MELKALRWFDTQSIIKLETHRYEDFLESIVREALLRNQDVAYWLLVFDPVNPGVMIYNYMFIDPAISVAMDRDMELSYNARPKRKELAGATVISLHDLRAVEVLSREDINIKEWIADIVPPAE